MGNINSNSSLALFSVSNTQKSRSDQSKAKEQERQSRYHSLANNNDIIKNNGIRGFSRREVIDRMEFQKLRRSNISTMRRQKQRSNVRASTNKHQRIIYGSGSSSKDLGELVKRKQK